MDVNLVMFREDGTKRVFHVEPGVTTIGRKDDCSIRIPLAVVSRRHAEIVLDDDGVIVKDLGSANGTYLNNQRIEEEDLEPGDQLMIGPVIFTAQIDGEPSDEELIEIRSRIPSVQTTAQANGGVTTSTHVAASDDKADPISALEAMASSADQTAITPEEDE